MGDRTELAAPGSPEELLVRRMDFERLPRHVAIIMDGNGRWAKSRGLPRVEGHRAGVEAVRDTIEACAQLGIEVLTLYAFSVENRKRPRYEIWTLMNLLKEYLQKELATLVDNDIRLQVIGRWLWQIAHTELWVTDTLWPDFGRDCLFRAIVDFQARHRRFGGVRDLEDAALSG